MRLTLLTLLAYLDDNLEPADARELEKKIEESKFASELVHRIRTCTRRLRLDAPKVDGKGMGLDPNTVAEFLDSTLPRDRFPDFEKVCLESDRHLAEVASCHQILTLVVDQPAQVPPGLRERIYRVGAANGDSGTRSASGSGRFAGAERYAADEPTPPPRTVGTAANEPEPPPTAGEAVPLQVGTASASRRSKRQPKSSRRWMLIAAALVLMLGGGWFAFIGKGPLQAFRELALGNGSTNSASRNAVANGESSRTPDARDSSVIESQEEGTTNEVGSRSEGFATDGAPESSDMPSTAPDDEAVSKAAEDHGADREAREDGNAPAVAKPDLDRTDGKGVASTGDETGRKEDANSKKPAGSRGRPAAPAPSEVARLLSEDQVLAHLDPATRIWYRMPRGAIIRSGESLRVLPTYRPIVALTNGLQLMLDGDTSLQIAASENDGLPVVHLDYGHAVFTSSGKNDSQVRLRMEGVSGTATLKGSDAELAIEVRRHLISEASDEPATGVVAIRWMATAGTVAFQADQGNEVLIGHDQMLVKTGDQPAELVGRDGPPAWLDPRKSVSNLDRRASRDLEVFLNTEKSLVLLLEERTNFRQVEVRSLAARGLGSLNEFGALLRELNDEKQRSYWSTAVDSLREAIAKSPESAAALQRAVESEQPGASTLITRFLQDYSQEQFEQGGAKQLIETLDHESLAVRVLAFDTLRRLTGTTNNYHPERPVEARKQAVLIWNQRLRDKSIPYRSPGAPVPKVNAPNS
ncbi:MAG: hypothetical protein RIS70_4489 [Planctomycetota bacterium]